MADWEPPQPYRAARSVLVGGANGQLEGETHVPRSRPGTPMANVMLSLLQKLGVNDIESFGNSTGTFAI